MKGIVKVFLVLLAAFCLFGCNQNPKEPAEITVDGLTVAGKKLGSVSWNASASGDTITWDKNYSNGSCGWDFEGIDLSEYSKVRVAVESSDASNLILIIDGKNRNNHHNFDKQVEPLVWEADLTGEGADYTPPEASPINKAEGLRVFLNSDTRDSQPRGVDQKTVVKSIELLK